MATKPADFVEKYSSEFGTNTPDVANVPQNADPKALLFGGNEPPPDPEDDFWKWDGEKQEFFVEVENGGRMERFSGKTRTEAAKNLAAGKKSLNQALAEAKAPKQLTPDTKLPFDPIQRKASRTLTQQEIYQITEMAQTDPLKAQEMLFEARTGYTMDQVAAATDRVSSLEQKIYASEVAGDFISSHQSEFVPSPANMQLMNAWLNDRKLPVTRNNLEIAFAELRGSGKLVSPVASVPRETPPVNEFVPPPPPVSPPTRPAPVAPSGQGVQVSREAVAAIQSGSLSDARAAIQDVFRQSRGGR